LSHLARSVEDTDMENPAMDTNTADTPAQPARIVDLPNKILDKIFRHVHPRQIHVFLFFRGTHASARATHWAHITFPGPRTQKTARMPYREQCEYYINRLDGSTQFNLEGSVMASVLRELTMTVSNRKVSLTESGEPKYWALREWLPRHMEMLLNVLPQLNKLNLVGYRIDNFYRAPFVHCAQRPTITLPA
jgi:hypothetical protein